MNTEFYLDANLPTEGAHVLRSEESRHLVRVRREREGATVQVTNGQGRWARCVLRKANPEGAVLDLELVKQSPPPRPLEIAVSPLHNESRWEWLVEKATELGATRIVPLQCERTEHHRWKPERLQRIIEAAMKQSLRLYLPVLNEPVHLRDWKPNPALDLYVAHCHPHKTKIPLHQTDASKPVILAVGPEGDFTESEIDHLQNLQGVGMDLGPHRLRTETAALVALSRWTAQQSAGFLLWVFITCLGFAGLASKASAQAPGGGTIALGRLQYGGGGDWYANPTSLPNLARFCNRSLGTTLKIQEEIAEVGSPDLFRFPWLHMTGHGRVLFSDQEARNLRNYLTGGGFLHVDDNYGMDPYVRSEFKKVFPELEWVRLGAEHPLYQGPFRMNGGLPKIHEHDGQAAQGLALVWENKVVVFYTFQCDLGDGWEDPAVHRDPENLRTLALQMGANIIRYAFEH
jgi:RsmE family RNA methyltransferase